MIESIVAGLRYSLASQVKILPLALSSSSGSLRGGILGKEVPKYGHHWRGNGLNEFKNRSRFRHDDPTGHFKAEEFSYRPGRGLYLGPLFNHFGHFLTESLSRVWAEKLLSREVDYCIFVPEISSVEDRKDFDFNSLPHWQREALSILGLRDVEFAVRPSIYEEMIIPEQSALLFSDYQSEIHRNMLRRACLDHFGPVKNTDKFVFKRPEGMESIDGERNFVQYFEERGYAAISPEELSFSEQVLVALRAKKVVGVQGSAFHIFNFIGKSDCDLMVIKRQKSQTTTGFSQTVAPYVSSVTMVDPQALGVEFSKLGQGGNDERIFSQIATRFDYDIS